MKKVIKILLIIIVFFNIPIIIFSHEDSKDPRNIKFYGAVVDGVTDDARVIITAMNNTNKIIFPKGTTRIATDLTIDISVEIVNGGIIEVDNSILNINGDFDADLVKVFNLVNNGHIYFTGYKLDKIPAEWFGATKFDRTRATINTKAINDAAESVEAYKGKVLLGPGEYYHDNTIYVGQGDQTGLIGAGDNVTRLICTSRTADRIIIGKRNNSEGYINEPYLYGFDGFRETLDDDSGGFDKLTAPAGIRVYSVANIIVEKVRCTNDVIGYYTNITTGSRLNSVYCIRHNTGKRREFYGFYLDGDGNKIIGSSVNGSFNSRNCKVLAALYHQANYGERNTYGVYLDGSNNGDIRDIWFDKIESGLVDYSIYIKSSGHNDFDIIFNNPILDQFNKQAIHIEALGPDSGVLISGGWLGGKLGSEFGLYAENCKGGIDITNVQIFGGSGFGMMNGIKLNNCRNGKILSNRFSNLKNGIILEKSKLINIRDCSFGNVTGQGSDFRISLINSDDCIINKVIENGDSDVIINIDKESKGNSIVSPKVIKYYDSDDPEQAYAGIPINIENDHVNPGSNKFVWEKYYSYMLIPATNGQYIDSIETKILFSNPLINVGGGWGDSTFTAPATGQYLICYSPVITKEDSGETSLYLKINGGKSLTQKIFLNSSETGTIPLSIVWNLNKGDIIEFWGNTNSGRSMIISTVMSISFFGNLD